jgi:hypothetical protein
VVMLKPRARFIAARIAKRSARCCGGRG